MLRDLIKEGGLYTLASLLTRGMTLLLLPFYASVFSTSDFGIFDILSVFGVLITAILCLQLNQGMGRYVAEPTNEAEKKKRIASSAIYFISGIYLISCLLFLAFPDWFVKVLSADVKIPLLTFQYAVVSITLTGIFYFIGVYLRFLRMSKEYATLSFFHALLSTLLTLLLVGYYKMGIDGVYISYIIVSPLIIISQCIVLRKQLVLEFDKKVLRPLFKYSLPLVPGAVAYVILNFTDRLFIKEISMSDAGIYAMASKFSLIISIIALGVSSALGPIVFQKHIDEETKPQLARIFRLFISLGSVGVLTLSLFSFETLQIFTNETFYGAESVMPVLYLAVFISGLSMFSIGLHIKEKTALIGIVVVISAGLNILLNYYLIAEYEMLGAAIATLISTIFNNFVLIFLSQRVYRLKIEYVKIFVAASVLIFFMYLGIKVVGSMDISLILAILLKIGLIAGYFFFLLFIKLVSLTKLFVFLGRN
ncbi:oligosaccharide flippase family protein [bacterium AH-315-B15]|nr:oligosaccharide flippase family protein [bacterium AH-315-B15]